MGQDKNIEKKTFTTPKSSEPESKREGAIDVGREEIKRLIDRIKELLDNYKLMPNSFLMPADYESKEVLDQKKNNKLRTTWFSLAFFRLRDSQEILGIEPAILENLQKNFHSVLQEEANQVKIFLNKEKLDFSDPTILLQRLKEIKRDLAPQFVEAKTQLIHEVEFVLRRNLAELQKKYAS